MNVKSIKEESGKIKKIFATIKKVISKEFLWGLFVLIVSIPVALIMEYIISVDAHILSTKISQEIEEVSGIITTKRPMFRVLYGISVVGIYFSRMVVVAVKTQLENKK